MADFGFQALGAEEDVGGLDRSYDHDRGEVNEHFRTRFLGLLHVAKGGLVLVKSRVDHALVYMHRLVRRGCKCGLDLPRGSVSVACDNRQSRSAARNSVNRHRGLKRLNPPKSQIQLHARRHVPPEQHKSTQPMI